MNQIDELLSELRFDGKFQLFDREQWVLVINHIISELGVLIEDEITPEAEDFENLHEGFCIRIKSSHHLGPLGLYLRGTVGADLHNDGKELRISSTLVVISENHRLFMPSEGETKHVIEFEFQRVKNNWQWISQGWQIDIYGEYEGY